MARKVKYDFNPFSKVRLRGESRESAKEEIKDYVLSQVLNDLGEARSPVDGQGFKALSPTHRAKKQTQGLPPIANLEFEGDLLDGLVVEDSPRGGIRITVSEGEQKKADGHNNFSGKSKLPRRAFIPDAKRDERFRSAIEEGIDRILQRYRNGS